MATYHTVEQGEHLARIALLHGFENYQVVWDHPHNAGLTKLRQNPNVLLPGDRVFIPDKQAKKESVATGNRHRFKLMAQPLALRVVLRDVNRQPIVNTACELLIEGEVRSLMTDATGMVELNVPKTAEQCQVVVRDQQIPARIGHLDPVEEISGQLARLNNLGYQAGAPDAHDARMRSAVEEFQCDHGLEVNGVCDAPTQAKLKEVHGC